VCYGLVLNHIIAVPRTLSKRQQYPRIGWGAEAEAEAKVEVKLEVGGPSLESDLELRPDARGQAIEKASFPNRG
jgi:hypothetical protein